jgi:hypothetical protein
MSLSQSSLPVFEIGLNTLSTILDKAAAFATARNIGCTSQLAVVS